jgi:hypothetical protein
MTTKTSNPIRRHRKWLLRAAALIALIALAIPIPDILDHVSNDPAVLGRYALDYFVFVAIYHALVVLWYGVNSWLWIFYQRRAGRQWLKRTRPIRRNPLIMLVLAVLPIAAVELGWDVLIEPTSIDVISGLFTSMIVAAVMVTFMLLVLREPTPAEERLHAYVRSLGIPARIRRAVVKEGPARADPVRLKTMLLLIFLMIFFAAFRIANLLGAVMRMLGSE